MMLSASLHMALYKMVASSRKMEFIKADKKTRVKNKNLFKKIAFVIFLNKHTHTHTGDIFILQKRHFMPFRQRFPVDEEAPCIPCHDRSLSYPNNK